MTTTQHPVRENRFHRNLREVPEDELLVMFRRTESSDILWELERRGWPKASLTEPPTEKWGAEDRTC